MGLFHPLGTGPLAPDIKGTFMLSPLRLSQANVCPEFKAQLSKRPMDRLEKYFNW